jgi:hypothetical protein
MREIFHPTINPIAITTKCFSFIVIQKEGTTSLFSIPRNVLK